MKPKAEGRENAWYPAEEPGIPGESVAGKPAHEPFEQTVGPAASPIHQLLAHLETLRETPEGERWPGTEWPTARAFEEADAFIRKLPLALVPAPSLGLADDGEINFLWKDDGVHVDLGFYGTRKWSYFACGRDGRRLHGDNLPVSEGLPVEIVNLFKT